METSLAVVKRLSSTMKPVFSSEVAGKGFETGVWTKITLQFAPRALTVIWFSIVGSLLIQVHICTSSIHLDSLNSPGATLSPSSSAPCRLRAVVHLEELHMVRECLGIKQWDVQGFSEQTCSRISQRGSLCNPQQASSLFLHPIEVDSAGRIRDSLLLDIARWTLVGARHWSKKMKRSWQEMKSRRANHGTNRWDHKMRALPCIACTHTHRQGGCMQRSGETINRYASKHQN